MSQLENVSGVYPQPTFETLARCRMRLRPCVVWGARSGSTTWLRSSPNTIAPVGPAGRQSTRHRQTGQTPDERFRPECLQPVPMIPQDYRDSIDTLIQRLSACVSTATVIAYRHAMSTSAHRKGGSSSITIYDPRQEIVRYGRCWRRGQTLGA